MGIGSCVELGDERLVRGHLSGAPCLEDRARRRNDEAFLKALPADSIPDPTTAGDFCRRFSSGQVRPLWDALNRARRNVRKRPPPEFFDEAFSDRAGTLTVTTGECQDGLEISDKGAWGDPPPVVSLANTRAVLSIVNRSGNRPREAGAADAADRAIKLCREAGFKIIRLRGDTALSQTEHLDRWPDAGDVRFQFGCDAKKTRLELAGNPPESAGETRTRPARYAVQTRPRAKPDHVKRQVIRRRQFEHLERKREQVAEFEHPPTACRRPYRRVVIRKNLPHEKGDNVLFEEIRYLLYLSKDRAASAAEIG